MKNLLLIIIGSLVLLSACTDPLAVVPTETTQESLERVLAPHVEQYGQPNGYVIIPDDGSRAYQWSVCVYHSTLYGVDYYSTLYSVQVDLIGDSWVYLGSVYSHQLPITGCR